MRRPRVRPAFGLSTDAVAEQKQHDDNSKFRE